MATLSDYKKLLRFSINTADINPNLYSDIKKCLIKPCKSLDVFIDKYYKNLEDEYILEGEYKTNENGHILELPEFGRFKENTKITIYSKESE